MKRIFSLALVALCLLTATSCTKDLTGADKFKDITTPRTNPVPDALVGRWAIMSISGTTVYDIPTNTNHNTNESYLGYEINKDGTTEETGYISTFSYGISTWAKWRAVGSVELTGGAINFHRARGSYTTNNHSNAVDYGASEVYPNKTAHYKSYTLGKDSQGNPALFVVTNDGATITYVKQ